MMEREALTEAEVAELAALDAKATPGPWDATISGLVLGPSGQAVDDGNGYLTQPDALLVCGMRNALSRLLAERREARVSLPVIATCGACGWSEMQSGDAWACCHPNVEKGRDEMGTFAPVAAYGPEAPPSWCPLRGAR